LRSGDRCPECQQGKVYLQREPGVLVWLIGRAPIEATIYELEKLRCNLCGEVFTAKAPDGLGSEKYDVTVDSMIAILRYGGGFPMHRLGKLEHSLGIPLPASVQWEMVGAIAILIRPVYDELVRQAAQYLHQRDCVHAATPEDRPVLHGASTCRRKSPRCPYRKSCCVGPPIQMCDALSRNLPKMPDSLEIIVSHCMAHARRRFVEVTPNFPEACRYVLEALGAIYHHDELARKNQLAPEERLLFHQQHSGPVMDRLHEWLPGRCAHR
jgi:transposase